MPKKLRQPQPFPNNVLIRILEKVLRTKLASRNMSSVQVLYLFLASKILSLSVLIWI